MISDLIKQKIILESASRHLGKQDRRVDFGEVFTPSELVIAALDKLTFKDGETFIDTTCGNGQILAAVKIIKESLGHSRVLEDIYGADIQIDNCIETIHRLYGDGTIDVVPKYKSPIPYCNQEGLISTFMLDGKLIKTIVHADALTYQYYFDELTAYDEIFNVL